MQIRSRASAKRTPTLSEPNGGTCVVAVITHVWPSGQGTFALNAPMTGIFREKLPQGVHESWRLSISATGFAATSAANMVAMAILLKNCIVAYRSSTKIVKSRRICALSEEYSTVLGTGFRSMPPFMQFDLVVLTSLCAGG